MNTPRAARSVIVVLALGLGALALAGCGGSLPASSAVKVGTPITDAPAVPTTLPTPVVDTTTQAYLNAFVGTDLSGAATSTPATLVKLGQLICTDLGTGLAFGDMVLLVSQAATQEGTITQDQAGEIIADAVENFCPSYSSTEQEWVAENS